MKDPLSIGLLGAGEWGPNLLRAFHGREDCRVLWVCDPNASRLDWVRPRYPGVEAMEDPGVALRRADTDAVAICTPTESHFRLCREALEAGKHVFVEKPMACSYSEAKTLVELAAKLRRKLMVGHVFLFHPGIRAVQRLLAEGVLGEPLYFSSERSHFGPVRSDVSVLWDLAPHDLAVMRWLFPEAPAYARAHGLSFLPGRDADSALVELRWGTGLVAHARLSWMEPRKTRRMMLLGERRGVVFEEGAGTFTVKLFAPEGKAALTPGGLMAYRDALRGDGENVELDRWEEPLGTECGAFVDWVRKGIPQASCGSAGADVVLLLEYLQRSMDRDGSAVDLRHAWEGGRA